LRATRRELEIELVEINNKLTEAISTGDLAALDKLTKRKSELPKLFIAASTAETAARRDMFSAEDKANLKRYEAAEAERDKLRAKLAKRQAEVEAEIAAIKEELQEAEGLVFALVSQITGSRNIDAEHEAGFKQSLAALAGVVQ
jgi:hypothetical protein